MKNKINYKLINVLVILLCIFVLYLLKDVWIGIISKLFNVLLPFIISFAIAYILYPILKFLRKKGVPKFIAIMLIVVVVLLVFGLTLYFALPVFFEQLLNLISNISKVSKDLALKYNVDMTNINKYIGKYSNKIVEAIEKFISSDSIINVISASANVIAKTIIIFIVTIYLLSDMDRIRNKVKEFFREGDKKRYKLIHTIDKEIYSYLKGLVIFMIIQFFEYTILFAIAGHPNFLLIGLLACITTVIPYFGGIMTNVFALIIASVVSPKVFIISLIITLIFPNIDGYVISPKIYGKTNKLPPLLAIFAVTTGGTLFGFKGIVIAVPITIILMAIYNAYKPEIHKKINEITND